MSADLADDPLVADEEDAAVVGVGDGHRRPVGQHVGVVGPVEMVRSREPFTPGTPNRILVRCVVMSIERMSWLSSSFVMSAFPPGWTNVSSSKTRCAPSLRSFGVGKCQSQRRRESTTRIRSLPRSAMSSAPGSGPLCVTTRFGSDAVVPVVVVAGRRARPLLDERAEERDRREHGEDDCETRPHGVTLAWQCELAMRLYLVLAAGDTHVLEPALRGGVDVVQLRDKTLTDRELIAAARPFRRACTRHRALFILNDRPDLVHRCYADGVHVGRSDASVAEARALVGPNRLVGLSASTVEELADVEGADYVGVTAFATPTKEDAVPGGLELVRDAAAALTVPWVAIGGIDVSNAAEVVAAGAPGIAVVRAIRDADDPEAAARELKRLVG